MTRFDLFTILVTLGAVGCGGFGGGKGGGGGSSVAGVNSGNTGPVVSASYLPTQVLRATAYSFDTIYTPNQAAGGAITALGAAPTTSDVWCGISPLGRVDHVDNTGQTAEASFVFDVSNFAVVGSNVFAATSNPIANRAGAVYSRDSGSAQWLLSLDGTQKECVVLDYMNDMYAFQGENDGLPGTVSALNSATGGWYEIATIGSMVPASCASYMGEAWVGGRSNNSAGGPAKLLHGNGVSFTEQKVPVQAFMGQIASVVALCEANGTLFVAVEVKDTVSGATTGGNLFYLDAVKGLVGINQMQNDAPICLAAADGTIYCGTRAGKLEWLDEKGAWNVEAGLPANLGVTALVWDGQELELGVRSQQGAQLLARKGTGALPPPPPSASGLVFTSISPASGPVAGGTAVTILGNKFSDVTVVTVGGVPLTNLKVVSDITITGTTGAGTAGAADVVIISPSKGTVTAKGAFSYQGAAPSLSYATDVLPIIQKECTSCHNAGFHPLNPYATLMAQKNGSTSYVVKGNVAGSYICQKIDATYGGGNATMASKVSATEMQTIEKWIQQGANP